MSRGDIWGEWQAKAFAFTDFQYTFLHLSLSCGVYTLKWAPGAKHKTYLCQRIDVPWQYLWVVDRAKWRDVCKSIHFYYFHHTVYVFSFNSRPNHIVASNTPTTWIQQDHNIRQFCTESTLLLWYVNVLPSWGQGPCKHIVDCSCTNCKLVGEMSACGY